MINLDRNALRKLQQTELEMMVEVDRICRKNNINYSLDGGTLLGAIRHNGFIPWDDDADIMMSRKEYERFFEACKKELDSTKFFLQEFRTDPQYRWGYSKMRRNNTLFLREGQEHIKCHCGICIDIFIFDNVPDEFISRRVQWLCGTIIRKGLYSEVGRKKEKSAAMRTLFEFMSFIPRSFWAKQLMNLADMRGNEHTKLISHLTYPNRKLIRYGISSDYYNEYIDKDFEGHSFRIIKNYDSYLRDLFDDYMELPPIEKRKVHPVSKIKFSLSDQ